MKKNTSYIISYLFTLVIGVLLLLFWNSNNIFETIVVVIGCCFLIPSLIGIFMGFAGKKNPDGTRSNRPWYVAGSSIAGIIGGALLVFMPSFFVHYLIYTLGVILVVVGIVQILFLGSEGRDIGGMPAAWYIMPWLTVAGGILVLILGPDKVQQIVIIVTGVLLTLYSVNGLMSAAAHKGTKHRQLRKAEKEAAETAEQTEAKADESTTESSPAEQSESEGTDGAASGTPADSSSKKEEESAD